MSDVWLTGQIVVLIVFNSFNKEFEKVSLHLKIKCVHKHPEDPTQWFELNSLTPEC